MTTMTVELGERSYPISIETDISSQSSRLQSILKDQRVVVVSNQKVADLYAEKLALAIAPKHFELILIPDGEQYKNLQTFENVIGELLAMNAGRDTILIALGGGVVGDLTGYVAASFQRGINAVLAMRVGRDFAAHRACRLDNSSQFVIRHLLACASIRIGQDPACGGDLDEVGSVFDRQPRGAAAIICAVAIGWTLEML